MSIFVPTSEIVNLLSAGLKNDHSRFTPEDLPDMSVENYFRPEDLSEMSAEELFSAGRPLRDVKFNALRWEKTVLLSAGRPLRDASSGSTALRIAINYK